MTSRLLIGFLFLVCFCCCSDNQKEHSGFYIENGPRQGYQYADSTGPAYHYRCITTTIINDSVAPMHLKINFQKEGNVKDSLNSRVFLLPLNLPPEKKQVYPGMSTGLRKFLSQVNETSVDLDTILASKEKCVVTFGILTEARFEQPNGIGLVASAKTSSIIPLGLRFDNNLVPCGHISFISNQK